MSNFRNSKFSTKPTNYYNLDMIIAIGFRVKSDQGTKFRIWANEKLKEYLEFAIEIEEKTGEVIKTKNI